MVRDNGGYIFKSFSRGTMLKAKELEELIDANKDMTEDDILEMYQHFKLLTGGSEVLSKESVLKQMEERNIESISKK